MFPTLSCTDLQKEADGASTYYINSFEGISYYT